MEKIINETLSSVHAGGILLSKFLSNKVVKSNGLKTCKSEFNDIKAMNNCTVISLMAEVSVTIQLHEELEVKQTLSYYYQG